MAAAKKLRAQIAPSREGGAKWIENPRLSMHDMFSLTLFVPEVNYSSSWPKRKWREQFLIMPNLTDLFTYNSVALYKVHYNVGVVPFHPLVVYV